MYTLYSNTLPQTALPSATVQTGDTNGATIDTALAGNNFRDVLFAITAGTLTDGSYAFAVQESDTTTDADFAAVDSARVLGSLPTFDSASDDNALKAFGVRPTKRYVRLVCTATGATTGGVLVATAILGGGSLHPVARS
ncbi:hypothetical protein [Mycobacterium malmoense]|uniref:hypothetical protein n=1 Tax=Mycobacterium malmoense TaxID=1780 RepID=UPI0008F8002C|nr:hypothetical protein [Mycobacterium malmoense]OIN79762.1 hypothetical protein BMG05_16580 [Mycobacterium malmoense]